MYYEEIMKVAQLYQELEKLIKDEKGAYDMMIRIRDEDRDLIIGISGIEDYRGGIGFVVLDSINSLDWY